MKYKILNLTQGSPEWIQARYDYITASQVPTLFDLCPYSTRLGLFEEKSKRAELKDNSGKEVLFRRGHSAEEAARKYLKEKFNMEFTPVVAVSTQYPFLLASLDGIIEDKGIIFEAKFVGAQVLKDVRDGEVPPNHLCQMQTALLVSGAEKCVYFVTDPSGDSHVLDVFPDLNYQELIAETAKAFWECVQSGEAPEPGEKDFSDVQDPLFSEYAAQKAKADIETAKLEDIKEKLTEKYADFSRVRCGGVRLIKSMRKGSVEYSKIPVLKGLDLEKYRKSPTTVYSIKIDRPQLMKGVA